MGPSVAWHVKSLTALVPTSRFAFKRPAPGLGFDCFIVAGPADAYGHPVHNTGLAQIAFGGCVPASAWWSSWPTVHPSSLQLAAPHIQEDLLAGAAGLLFSISRL